MDAVSGDDSARNEILHFWSDEGDEGLLRYVDSLAREKGDSVYRDALYCLTEKEYEMEDASAQWKAVIERRHQLGQLLQRPVSLLTALCDLQAESEGCKGMKLVQAKAFERTSIESTQDGLTGLFNRHYLKHALEQQLALARRYNADLAFLFLDIDDFKDVNDRYGHLVGDKVLAAVSAIIEGEIRQSDIAARYGGEEFVVIMPQTNCLDALILADRIRREIEELPIEYDNGVLHVTISGGISAFPLNAKNTEELIYLADSALYRAKGAGKNTISLFKEDKRRFLRISFHQPIKIKELGFNTDLPFTGMGKDICIGGILFENERSMAIGTKIQLSVPIGEKEPLLLIGTVVRVECMDDGLYDIGVAMSFKEMDKLAKNEISRFLFSQTQGVSANYDSRDLG